MPVRACLVVFLAAFVLSEDVEADLLALFEFEGDYEDATGSVEPTELGLLEYSDDTPNDSDQALILSSGSGLNCGNISGEGDDLSVAFWLKEGISNGTYSVCLSMQEIDPWAGPHPVDPVGFSVLLRSSADEAHSIIFRLGAWQTYGGWGSELRTTPDVYGTDRWAHFVFTYDDETDTATAYVDGELNATMTGIKDRGVGGAASRDHDLVIGQTQETFQGFMDDIALFDHVLTEDEVLDIFDGTFDEYFPSDDIEFVRGDANDDGSVDLADAVFTLNRLFGGGDAPACLAALNTNGDEAVNITDPVSLLNFLFAAGATPVAPYPDCGPGQLPGDTLLGCENSSNCP